FDKEVEADEDHMYVAGDKIVMTAFRDPAEIPWKRLGVDVVVESTGVFRHRAPLEKHLEAG
ncbi:MAG: type I glyceraldehyde-3-phosphate dehydrogenase, partial [Actinobacteria bacterium]|nr:type I glyceraldehyde-3-phosphate dehydrogenase [Actinomycetota bacterium]NIW28185.1 type I glyceraldehyde-3-phosphate dehydrogenase [Actinomycetota bacterium]